MTDVATIDAMRAEIAELQAKIEVLERGEETNEQKAKRALEPRVK